MRDKLQKKTATKIHYCQTWPKHSDLKLANSIVIYDQILTQNQSQFRDSKKWIEKFPNRLPVFAGEKLKNISSFSKILEQIIKISANCEKPLQIVAIGGGSVGDFAGFLASVLKRGVDLIHIPSTWLSAIDSAHGGKNALNISGYKNQIGTFHFAKEIFLIKPLLCSQPASRLQEAMGEILKIALLDSKKLWKSIDAGEGVYLLTVENLWKKLPSLVQAKYKIIKKDPFEKNGIRHLLNFGHTIGHIFESQLNLPHGIAVSAGLGFSLQYSLRKKILSIQEFDKIMSMHLSVNIPTGEFIAMQLRQIKNAKAALMQDKKMKAKQNIRFVFLRRIGQGCVQTVTVNQLIAEIKRQSK